MTKLETAKRFDAICDSRADARIARVFKAFLAEDGFLTDALGRCFAHERDRTAKQLRELRRELTAAQVKIKELQREKAAPEIVGWKIDRIKYRAVPFYADGRPGTPIPLRGLFEAYHAEVNR